MEMYEKGKNDEKNKIRKFNKVLHCNWKMLY